jgi:hypothetical protein
MSQEETEKKLELILWSSTLDEMKAIIRGFNDKVVAEGRKEDRIKGLSLPKEGLIRSIQQFMSDDEKKKLYHNTQPKFMQTLLQNADSLLNGWDKREKITSWNNIAKGYSINISGFQWEETTTVQQISTGMYRKCTCRIGKLDGFCVHEMSIFLRLLNEQIINLTDFPLPMDSTWIKKDSHGQIVPSSQSGLSLDSFNEWRKSEKLPEIQLNGTINDVLQVIKIGNFRESEYGRYLYVTGELTPYKFQIRFTEDRFRRSYISEKDYIYLRGKIKQIKGDTIFIGRVSELRKSDASKYKIQPKLDKETKETDETVKTKVTESPIEEQPKEVVPEEKIVVKKIKKSSKKKSKEKSEEPPKVETVPVKILEQRIDADIEFDDGYQIFIEDQKTRLKWGGPYPGDKIIDTSEGKDDIKLWLGKKVIEKLTKLSSGTNGDATERTVNKITKDNYGIIEYIIETQTLVKKLLKGYKDKQNLPQNEDELKEFLKIA